MVAASRPTLQAGFCLLFVGRPRKRASTSWRCARLLERGQDSEGLDAGIYLSWIECLRGDLIAAHGYAREAHEAAEGVGSDSGR